MKSENGMGIIAIIISVLIIALIVFWAYRFFENTVDEQKIEDIRANMLLIQGKTNDRKFTGSYRSVGLF